MSKSREDLVKELEEAEKARSETIRAWYKAIDEAEKAYEEAEDKAWKVRSEACISFKEAKEALEQFDEEQGDE